VLLAGNGADFAEGTGRAGRAAVPGAAQRPEKGFFGILPAGSAVIEATIWLPAWSRSIGGLWLKGWYITVK